MRIPALLLVAAVWTGGSDALVFRAQLFPGPVNIRGVRYTEGWTGDAARQNLLITNSPPQLFAAPTDHHASRPPALNIRSHPVSPGFLHGQVTPVHFTSYQSHQASPSPQNFGINRPTYLDFGGVPKTLQAPDIASGDWLSPNNKEQVDSGHLNQFLSLHQNFAFNHQLQGNVPVRQPTANIPQQKQNYFQQTLSQQGAIQAAAINDFGRPVQPTRNLHFNIEDVSTSFGIPHSQNNSFNGTTSNFTFAGNVATTVNNASASLSNTQSASSVTSNVENSLPRPAALASNAKETETEAQQENEVAKATLEDVIRHDCPNADQLGYCASPPRYPTLQIEEVYKRCIRLLRALYVPLPEEDNTKSITRANRHAWSWRDAGRESCSGNERREAPGYVRDASSGRWLVVVQTESMPQQVHVQVCARRCRHTCSQRWGYAHLVTWDPDAPSLCPRLAVARLPTSCHCAAVVGDGVQLPPL
ncbi:uncharacterized protein LOC124722123 [Schistocerca piceifrons]|uniref:uncharacterized protein LOC124722123 n=1 Tax=Schistocerca piceifrons TaxID=274613 RepID=UPI001F5E99E9|nr:uncharacterized protein LOC124722123 [Schistocerca piceifrons]